MVHSCLLMLNELLVWHWAVLGTLCLSSSWCVSWVQVAVDSVGACAGLK